MKVKISIATAMATVAIGLAATPVAASPPVGGCPQPFEGPLTFAEVIEAFPPPPDFEDPEGYLATLDFNNDGRLCVQPTPVTFIDNVVRIR